MRGLVRMETTARLERRKQTQANTNLITAKTRLIANRESGPRSLLVQEETMNSSGWTERLGHFENARIIQRSNRKPLGTLTSGSPTAIGKVQ